MAHPEILNQTPFVVEPLFATDEDGRPILAPILKATLDVDLQGQVTVAQEQVGVNFAGECYGEPGESSYRFEPETAFMKPATDVVLVGHARPPRGRVTELEVTLLVGYLRKTLRVVGDRHVVGGGVGPGMSRPHPFEMMPLTWERAFGGWDRSPADPEDHSFEPRNPVGTGFVGPRGRIFEGSPLPNIEDPRDPLTAVGGRCKPAGFGFISPNWHPRSTLAGTYDDKWAETRSPLLPGDFDRRFFNAASEGLVAPGYLAGTEWVQVYNATPGGHWAFQLPGVSPPRFRVKTRRGEANELVGNLDTVIVDADRLQVQLLWRACAALREGPLDVASLHVHCELIPEPLARTAGNPVSGTGL
jgi:hypothetical protein